MKTLRTNWIVVILLFCISCQSETNRFQEYIQKNTHLEITSNIKYIVIIPSAGCGGYISYMEEFYRNNKELQSVIYIFTNFISKKMLSLKIGSNFSTNTYLDEKNIVMDYYPRDKQIYPCILELSNGKIKSVHYQSPLEDGLSIIQTTNK